MTPRREWFKSYSPCNVPIRIANGQVVFAAGRGTVEFTPVKDSHKLCPVLFSNVLHVPALNQNLLSMLTLTCDHAFDIHIHFRTIEFIKDSIPCFYASVGADRVALLSGSTVVSSQVASPAQTAGYELWHHRFGHISPSCLKLLVELEMMSNLSLPSVPSSVPVCPLCMDGKQTRDSFPQSASHHSVPLELIVWFRIRIIRRGVARFYRHRWWNRHRLPRISQNPLQQATLLGLLLITGMDIVYILAFTAHSIHYLNLWLLIMGMNYVTYVGKATILIQGVGMVVLWVSNVLCNNLFSMFASLFWVMIEGKITTGCSSYTATLLGRAGRYLGITCC